MNTFNLDQWKKHSLEFVETTLDKMLPHPSNYPNGDIEKAMRYSVLSGGKRVRALLAIASAQMSEHDPQSLQEIITALECIHAYSLIHDDLPILDDDDLRRGQPTCHIAFGEPCALLAGDALHTFAFEVLSNESSIPLSQKMLMINNLAHSVGIFGMCLGQAIDVANVDKSLALDALKNMHELKTGALITSAMYLGSLCHLEYNPQYKEHLFYAGRQIGLAFQVIDDILDSTQDTSVLGKTAGKDEKDNKPTFVSLLGLDNAREYAKNCTIDALNSLKKIPNSDTLSYFVESLLNRQF